MVACTFSVVIAARTENTVLPPSISRIRLDVPVLITLAVMLVVESDIARGESPVVVTATVVMPSCWTVPAVTRMPPVTTRPVPTDKEPALMLTGPCKAAVAADVT